MLPLLGDSRVIDDPARNSAVTFHCIKHAVTGHSQHGGIVPFGIRNEMMHRLVPRADMPWVNPSRHRLDALPITRETQPRQVCSKRRGTIGMSHDHRQKLEILLKPLLGGVVGFGHDQDDRIFSQNASMVL
jgi:hypothetical protein